MSILAAMNKRARIYQLNRTDTDMGTTEAEVDQGERWCALIPLDVRAQAAYQQLKSENPPTHKLLFRAGSWSPTFAFSLFQIDGERWRPSQKPYLSGDYYVIPVGPA